MPVAPRIPTSIRSRRCPVAISVHCDPDPAALSSDDVEKLRGHSSLPCNVSPVTHITRIEPMPKYMLLLHDNPAAFATLSPEDIQKVIQKYMAWSAPLRSSGVITESAKLTDEPGRVVRGKGAEMRVTDGP